MDDLTKTFLKTRAKLSAEDITRHSLEMDVGDLRVIKGEKQENTIFPKFFLLKIEDNSWILYIPRSIQHAEQAKQCDSFEDVLSFLIRPENCLTAREILNATELNASEVGLPILGETMIGPMSLEELQKFSAVAYVTINVKEWDHGTDKNDANEYNFKTIELDNIG